MVISKLRGRSIPSQQMMLLDQPMDRVSSYRYLGVIISEDLSWSPHIEKITSKARRLVGMLYRNFYQWSSPDSLLKLYLSLIRPHLEYAVQVWNPYLAKDIQKLEAVQRFALRMCLKQWNSSYTDLLRESEVPELTERRKFLNLMYFYKTINGHIITSDNIITARHCSHNTRLSSQTTYYRPLARSNVYHNSFFPSTISLWNSLPQDVVCAPSIMSFKHSLLRTTIL